MDNFIITITYLLIGMALKRIPRFPAETGNVLNLFVIYISLPALVLLKIGDISPSFELLTPAAMPWVMVLFSALVILGLSRILRWDRQVTGCLLLLVPLGNTSFLGIPMVQAFFGESGVSYALLYDQLGSFLALAIYGSLILALFGKRGNRPTLREACLKFFSFPPFIALVVSIALRGFSYPLVVETILKGLSATLVPVVMIAVGFQLTLRLGREVASPLLLGLLVKLVAAPLMALGLCRLLGLQGEVVDVTIFEAGMPPMVSAGAVAILADLHPALTAALVGVGIIFCFVTLPLLYQLL